MIKRRLSSFFQHIAQAAIEGQKFKPFADDVFLVSYPKSGNTWARWLIAAALRELSDSKIELNWSTIIALIPDLETSRFIKSASPFPLPGLPRLIKSHSGARRDFLRVICLVRHPVNVIESYFTYLSDRKIIDENVSIESFAESDQWGVTAWKRFHQGWIDVPRDGRLINFFRYEDLQKNPAELLLFWLQFIGVKASIEVCERAVLQCDSAKMRASEAIFEDQSANAREMRSFVGEGIEAKERYRTRLSKEHVRYVEDECRDLLKVFGYK